MSPRKIILLLTVAALAIGNYTISLEAFRGLLVVVGMIWVVLAIHAHLDAVADARQKGRDEGRGER